MGEKIELGLGVVKGRDSEVVKALRLRERKRMRQKVLWNGEFSGNLGNGFEGVG
jgi:hypothetical protein